MSNPLVPTGPEKIVFNGELIQVINQDVKIGTKTKTFWIARRTPGTRVIVRNPRTKEILLVKEFRIESERNEFRLPGGKVFKTAAEYTKARDTGANIVAKAQEGAVRELQEETGLKALSVKHIRTSGSGGSTIDWDLYYFLIEEYSEGNSKNPDPGEVTENIWFPEKKIMEMCLNGLITEDRTVAVLLKLLLKEK